MNTEVHAQSEEKIPIQESIDDESGLLTQIHSGNTEDFIQLFDSTDFSSHQFSFSEEEVDELVERYILATILNDSPSEEVVESGEDHHRRRKTAYKDFVANHDPFSVEQRNNYSEKNISDQVMESVVRYVKTHKNDLPDSLEAVEVLLSDNLLQNSHMIKSDVLFNAATEILWVPELNYSQWDEKILSRIKGDFIAQVQYQIDDDYNGVYERFFRESLVAAIVDKNELQLTKLVEFLRQVGIAAASEDYSEATADTILGSLLEAAQMADNYFLRERIIQAYAQIREQLIYINDEDDTFEMVRSATSGKEYQENKDLRPDQHNMTDYIRAKEDELLNKAQSAKGNYLKGFTYAQLAPGYVGIYGSTGIFQGFQTMENFTSQEHIERKHPEDLPLFSAHIKNNKDVESRNEATQDMVLLLSQPFRKQIEEDFGVDLAELDLRIQNQFLTYLKNTSVEDASSMAEYAKIYGKNFFTSFLSLEEGDNMGNIIISICENINQEEVEKIFKTYTDMVTASEKVREYLKINFSEQVEIIPGLEDKIVEGLLKKGKNILEQSSKDSELGESTIGRLDEVSVELQVFASAFKVLSKEELAQLEQFPGTELQEMKGGEDLQDTKDKMIKISDRNWSTRPHMHEMIMADFMKSLEDPQSNFYIVKNGDEIVSFFRMDEKGPDERYFGSVNVSPEIHGNAMAPALLQQVFLKEAENKLVKALCDPWDKVTDQYIGDIGFVATELVEYGQPCFRIEREDRSGKKPEYQFAGKSYKELLQLSISDPNLVYSYTFTDNPVRIPGEPENDRFVSDMQRLLDGGHVISNVRSELQKNGKRHVLIAIEPKYS